MKERRSFLSILCFILISFGVASVSAQTCIQNRKYFTPNDTYDANRHIILSSLPSNAAARDGFYNGSIGEEPNRIYAVGMCFPGSSPGDCSDCIKGASDWLKQDCTNQTDAYYWALDPTLCLVRYANAAFSGASAFWEITPQYLVMNTAIIKSNLTEFKNIWEDLTVRMFAAASASRSTPTSSNNHYTANVVALSKFQNIYALMHCTPDISPGDCDNCLRLGVGEYQNCCANNTGGYVMRPICFFRWQSFTFSKAFGNITLAPPPSPSPFRPLSPPPLPRPAIASQPPSAADPAKTKEKSSGNTMRTIVAIFVGVVVIIIIISGLFVWWFARSRRQKPFQEVELNQNVAGVTTVRSLQFKYKTIKEATNNFSTENEIAKGGFGEVFKGILPDGKEIAVKRLFATNEQSTKEFKNEVVVVAKLQHRNLVKLIGFSVKGEEKIIVYELLPNKSLDYILFEPTRQGELDWKKRYEIIKGTARGILYLHQGSRLTIIHRDLKPGNILLDNDMNPKIADFGTARIFGMDQTRAHTKKGVGTPGYMPPEYINEWQFSVKTDVYSFGVIVLEIICGKADKSFTSQALNLVTYAWRLWINGSPLDLLDPTIAGNFQTEKVTRCIHIALLCVQEDPEDRPDFSIIMSMLTSKSLILDVPKTPGLCIPDRSHQSTTRSSSQTINDGT